MKQKKLYRKPTVKSIELNADSIICMSTYDDEAPFVGVRRRSNFVDEDDFEFEE